MMKDEYNFEQYLQQGLMDYTVMNARRFEHAVRKTLSKLEKEAHIYGIQQKDFYVDTKIFLETMLNRLTAEPNECL